MINVNQITAQMARMSDPALQQYAAMHKSDPYTLSLALSESNRRKQMRQAAQMGQQQPQPKVVDQEIAQMGPQMPPQQGMPPQQLPENVGIGQLPAPNMQGMAEGGIVAFEDGGKVPGYQAGTFTGTDAFRMFLAQQGISGADFFKLPLEEQARIRASAPSPLPAAAPAAAPSAAGTGIGTPKPASAGLTTARGISAGVSKVPLLGMVYDLIAPANKDEERASFPYKLGAGSAQTEDDVKKTALKETPNDYAEKKVAELEAASGKKLSTDARNLALSRFVQEKIALDVKQGKAGFTTSADPIRGPDINSMADTGGGAAPTGNPAGGIKPAPSRQGLDPNASGQNLMAGIPGLTQTATGMSQEFQNVKDQFGQPTVPYAIQQKIDAYQKKREEEAQGGLKDLQEDQAKQGLGMEAAEKRTKERGEKLSKREADLPGLAIFQAGLAIMGGESPYALTNIGKGAGLGLKMYTEGLDKLEASREKLDESFDKIELFRQNRADMNAKEIRAAKKDIRATRVEGEKLGLDALINEGGMNRADARTAFTALIGSREKMYDITSRERLGLTGISAQRDIAGMQVTAQTNIANQRNQLMQDLYGGEARARTEFGKIQQKIIGELSKDQRYQIATPEARTAMERDRLAREISNNPFLAPYAMGIGFQKAPAGGMVRSLDAE
jgi:hypothetical protein